MLGWTTPVGGYQNSLYDAEVLTFHVDTNRGWLSCEEASGTKRVRPVDMKSTWFYLS